MENLLDLNHKPPIQLEQNVNKSDKIFDIAMKSLVNQLKFISIGLSPMQQLELKYDDNDVNDISQLRTILSKNLSYPSLSVAETHHNANRLGHYDIHRQKEELSTLINDNTRFCACCGFVEQQQTLSINQDLKNVDHIGVSTYIYFLTIKHILILMISMMLIFSIYALMTNKTNSDMYQTFLENMSQRYNKYKQKINLDFRKLAYSSGSKQFHKTSYAEYTFRIQCWLGVVTISLWALLFVFFKYRQQTAEYDVDYDSITASDFSLYFENLPKSMTPQLLQKQLRDYQQQMKGQYHSHFIQDPITVVKIVQAAPFYLNKSIFEDNQLKQISKQCEECKRKLIEMVKERKNQGSFSISIDERTELCNNLQLLKSKKVSRIKQITDQIIEQKKQESTNCHFVPAFVTFGSNYNKEFLERVHDDRTQYRFIYNLPCFSRRRKYFHYQNAQGERIAAKILPAPEPEDILWTNLGQDTCKVIKKKMLTFFVTLVLLTISFFVTYLMYSLQLSLNQSETTSTISKILSPVISLFISIYNIIINKILYSLTKYERNETYINEQTSLGLKTAFAVLINSILIPIIVNKTLKYNLYGVDGLAQDVYYFAITNALLAPILKIIDPTFLTNRAMRWYYNRPQNRLPLNQNQLNSINELLQFSIGYQYIYLVNVFLFTCFFVSLQPIIVFFAILGLFLMFYAQKYYLFNRCRRPTPGYTSINTAMYQLFYLGPMMYSLGSFCQSNNFFDLPNPVGTVPNTMAMIVSGVVFIFPYKKLLKCIVAQRPEQKLVFQEDRIFLPSEYDRMNPQTAQKASIQYKDYIANYKGKLRTSHHFKFNKSFINQVGNVVQVIVLTVTQCLKFLALLVLNKVLMITR